ncbi:MAG: SUMF1/EgtB/PvdO family nonheme iron enzyme [Phycisphaerae bacterium]|nr:SUMF1/EgtB/PvdO family nonheme iron enzyme [Phycisphaerae bacterium]
MKLKIMLVAVVLLSMVSIVSADTFGTGANEFTIDFVTISGSAGDGYGGQSAGSGFTTSNINNDYRIGKFEISNDQYAKFASNSNVIFTGADVPSNRVSWFDAAKFVNYLNTCTGHIPAYKFVKIDLTDNYGMSVWDVLDNGYDEDNPFRNSNAKYFLPTEDEWVKAAYWNGTNLQTFATTDGSVPVAGVDTNYKYAVGQPWDISNGSEELNGTYNMMGNVREWTESNYYRGFSVSFYPSFRGGSYYYGDNGLSSFTRDFDNPSVEASQLGFRVASNVPEPCSLVLLGLGGLMLHRRKR